MQTNILYVAPARKRFLKYNALAFIKRRLILTDLASFFSILKHCTHHVHVCDEYQHFQYKHSNEINICFLKKENSLACLHQIQLWQQTVIFKNHWEECLKINKTEWKLNQFISEQVDTATDIWKVQSLTFVGSSEVLVFECWLRKKINCLGGPATKVNDVSLIMHYVTMYKWLKSA